MNNTNRRVKNDNLRNLIILCTYNIKGITSAEKIAKYLPIEEEDLSIHINSNKIIVKNKDKIDEVLSDESKYINIDLLKTITPYYGIRYEDNNILELMKYRNNIIYFLI